MLIQNQKPAHRPSSVVVLEVEPSTIHGGFAALAVVGMFKSGFSSSFCKLGRRLLTIVSMHWAPRLSFESGFSSRFYKRGSSNTCNCEDPTCQYMSSFRDVG